MLAHAWAIASFVLGAAFIKPVSEGTNEVFASQKMVRAVCISATGFATIGFGGLFLALIGCFNLPALCVTLALLFAAGNVIRRESPLRFGYWRTRALALGAAWSAPSLFVYYVLLMLALPAMNLVNFGADPRAYHLAYAADWANTGRLVVDPFLDPPFYASNFSISYAILMLLGGGVFANFLVWLVGLLAALGLSGTCAWMLEEQGFGRFWSGLSAVFLTLAVIFAPSYLLWLDSAYIDVPIGAFALFAVLALLLGLRERQSHWLYTAAILAGYFAGLKGSFPPLVVVFALATWIAARQMQASRKSLAAVLALLVVASSPWYVRNTIAAGDPIAPVLNMMLYGRDGLFTKSEVANISADLHRVRSPQQLITLPYRAFMQAGSNDFRADGTSALVLGLYILVIIPLVALSSGKRLPVGSSAVLLVLFMLVGYWAFTSTSLRYASVFIALVALGLSLVAGFLLGNMRARGMLFALIAALSMIPSMDSYDFYRHWFDTQFSDLPISYINDSDYQQDRIDGLRETNYVVSLFNRMATHASVYVLDPGRGEDLHYYFRIHGIMNAGTWAGPASWFRLFNAIDAGEGSAFMKDVNAQAILVGNLRMAPAFSVPLGRQLRASGFCNVQLPRSDFQIHVWPTKEWPCGRIMADAQH